MTDPVNSNGLTLAQFRMAALEAESKYGDNLLDLGDMQDLFNEWDNNSDPDRLVDELALEYSLDYPADWAGDVMRYWLVLGRFEFDENQTFVCKAYNMEEAKTDLFQTMREDSDRHVDIELVISCGREYPEYSQNEEV